MENLEMCMCDRLVTLSASLMLTIPQTSSANRAEQNLTLISYRSYKNRYDRLCPDSSLL